MGLVGLGSGLGLLLGLALGLLVHPLRLLKGLVQGLVELLGEGLPGLGMGLAGRTRCTSGSRVRASSDRGAPRPLVASAFAASSNSLARTSHQITKARLRW